MIIMKFGGTSVGNDKRIRNTCNIIKSRIKRRPVVVVSAVAKITDSLIKLANESVKGKGNDVFEYIRKTHYDIIEKLNLDEYLLEDDFMELLDLINKTKSNKSVDVESLDYFQSFGERFSSKIVAEQLNKIGVKSKAFNSWELGFLTDDEFGNAEPIKETYKNLRNSVKRLNFVPVITGFIGKTKSGKTTTLGRGGSDYTAAIIGAAINTEEIQIWSDVDGIMSTDPRAVKNARAVEKVSFAEASELAYFGARVLHPKTILPAMGRNIPVRVLNSFNPGNKGTLIVNKSNRSRQTVKAIAYKNNTTLISVESTRMLGAYGFLAKIFEIFGKYRKSVDVISTSEVSVSLTVDNGKDVGNILEELKQISDVGVLKNKSIICIVGEGLKETTGIISKTFGILEKNKINIEMISQGASKINITFIVDGKDANKSVRLLHKGFFGD